MGESTSGRQEEPTEGDLETFRHLVRTVLDGAVRRKSGGGTVVSDVASIRALQARLADAGLAGITFPPELGGAGLSVAHGRVFDEVAGEYAFDDRVLAASLGICAPALLAWGTAHQRRAHVPRMLRAEEVWCQLFSEPSAGSDLAGLRTMAIADGGGWVLNGQKVWNSFARESDYGLCIARTDPELPKHAGLSAFIVDMRDPGVEVRPIRQITGSSEFDEVFLTDVRLDPDAMIGSPGDGWRVALSVMSFERRLFGLRGLELLARYADKSIAAARAAGKTDDPTVRQEIADIFIKERVLTMAATRVEDAVLRNEVPGPEGSIVKIGLAELSARATSFVMGLAGPRSVAWEEPGGELAYALLDVRALSVGGGTTEVQRNIVAERILGLPRDHAADRDVPYRQLRPNG